MSMMKINQIFWNNLYLGGKLLNVKFGLAKLDFLLKKNSNLLSLSKILVFLEELVKIVAVVDEETFVKYINKSS